MQDFLKSYKTALFGGIPGIGVIVDGVSTKNWAQVFGGVGLLLVSIFAKDANVSGTTK